MTTMFGVNISQIIADEVGPGVFPATLTIVTPGTRTSSTSGVKPTETTSSGRGFVESFDAGSIDGSIIKKDDVSAILIADTFTPAINPKAGDKVTIQGSTYRIQSVNRDPASATYTCHSRK